MKKEDKQQQAIVQQKTQESIQKQQTILLMTQCFIGSVHYDVGMRDLRKISKFFSYYFFKFLHDVMKHFFIFAKFKSDYFDYLESKILIFSKRSLFTVWNS